MNGQVLRLAPAVAGGRVVEVPIGRGELARAKRLRRRLARFESVRSGDRSVGIVPAGGDAP